MVIFRMNVRAMEDRNVFAPSPTDPEALKAYEIAIFREYLRIPSVHPDIDYGKPQKKLEFLWKFH